MILQTWFFKFRILVENNANLAAVNNEGEVPLDLADEDEMDEYLSDEIDNQGDFYVYFTFLLKCFVMEALW